MYNQASLENHLVQSLKNLFEKPSNFTEGSLFVPVVPSIPISDEDLDNS
jgi:hypothetical protein